jgi:GTP-binding protein Era
MEDAKTKSGFVALIGRPNVGKSTLMNHLIGQKIAITSRKPQTTRNQIRTIYNSDRGQIVFVDTPGMHRASNKLGEYMVSAADNSLRSVDAALWLIEPDSYVGAGDKSIVKKLQRSGLPVILVINKIDKVSKAVVAATIEAYKGLLDFDDIVAVSAKQSTNLDTLIDSIFKVLPYGPKFFPDDEITDQPMRQLVAEIIREKALRSLGEEVPHGIAVTINKMQERTARHAKKPKKKAVPAGADTHAVSNQDVATSVGQNCATDTQQNAASGIDQNVITDIDAEIICERESHKGIIIGHQGSMLKKIGSEARADIENLTGTKVNLQLHVKVKTNWRESDVLVKNFGYDKKNLDS